MSTQESQGHKRQNTAAAGHRRRNINFNNSGAYIEKKRPETRETNKTRGRVQSSNRILSMTAGSTAASGLLRKHGSNYTMTQNKGAMI